MDIPAFAALLRIAEIKSVQSTFSIIDHMRIEYGKIVNPILSGEYHKENTELRAKLAAAEKRIKELEAIADCAYCHFCKDCFNVLDGKVNDNGTNNNS